MSVTVDGVTATATTPSDLELTITPRNDGTLTATPDAVTVRVGGTTRVNLQATNGIKLSTAEVTYGTAAHLTVALDGNTVSITGNEGAMGTYTVTVTGAQEDGTSITEEINITIAS